MKRVRPPVAATLFLLYNILMTKKLIVGNWKMNPESADQALELFTAVSKFGKKYSSNIVICPPFPYLGIFAGKKREKIALGAQDVFSETKGAFTGGVSPKMLSSLGVAYVILGHSERRALGETNAEVSKKITFALKENLHPIVCVGEKERDHDGHFFNTIRQQLLETLAGVSKNQISKIIIAYEPLWAISTAGQGAMKPGDIHETVLFIKKILSDRYGKNVSAKVRILYGGSVDGTNANLMIKEGHCDGLLVGRASLSPVAFENILQNIY